MPYDQIRATPQNPALGAIAAALRKAQEFAGQYQVLPQVPLLGGTGVDELLGLPGAAREIENWSYGNYPMRINPNAGRTASYIPEIKPGRKSDLADTLLLGMDVAPLAAIAKRGTVTGARAIEDATVGALQRARIRSAASKVPEDTAYEPLRQRMEERGNLAYAVKPKGGNWLAGSVENAVAPLKRPDRVAQGGNQITLEQALNWPGLAQEAKRDLAINKWLESKLEKYIRNEMGTPEDPVRALAERGVLHVDPENLTYRAHTVHPTGEVFDKLGQSEAARSWETASDFSITPEQARTFLHTRNGLTGIPTVERNPWLAKVPPETSVYDLSVRGSNPSDLGFDHLVDELRNAINPESGLPRELLLSPDKLDKVTVPQAVELVDKINKWRAAQKAEADLLRANNAATVLHKEYPEAGYKWVELKMPEKVDLPEGYQIVEDRPGFRLKSPDGKLVAYGNTPEDAARGFFGERSLKDALKYEGDTMGHCVGGYCDDVASGKSRIYSLRDAKGQPHVTIEVSPPVIEPRLNGDVEIPGRIVQIKGKQNRAPNPEYLPFVQDFVKSGQWSDVGDLQNTGMIQWRGGKTRYRAKPGAEPMELNMPSGYLTPGEAAEFLMQQGAPEDWARQHVGDVPGLMKLHGVEGYAEGGAVEASTYDPARVDDIVNQIREGIYG